MRLQRAYREYNKKYFGNRLPKSTQLRWADMSMMGYQLDDEIVINRRDRKRDRVWKGTLLHEMVHLSLPKTRFDHGKEFQKEMLRLAKLGAFRNIW